jgi:hypothetical protein
LPVGNSPEFRNLLPFRIAGCRRGCRKWHRGKGRTA